MPRSLAHIAPTLAPDGTQAFGEQVHNKSRSKWFIFLRFVFKTQHDLEQRESDSLGRVRRMHILRSPALTAHLVWATLVRVAKSIGSKNARDIAVSKTLSSGASQCP